VAARLIALALVVSFLSPGEAVAQEFDHRHRAWEALLKQHVVLADGGKASRVHYAGMAEGRAALKAYLGALGGKQRGVRALEPPATDGFSHQCL
jgi:hypothetical protein